ncbi:MAG: TonB-dependent receptor [Candidatus Manganitrophus sp.]|nr:TonB-dependent receptor [Candidatus Manganitrophus sp.]
MSVWGSVLIPPFGTVRGIFPKTLWNARRYTETNAPFDGGRKERQEVNANYNYDFSPNSQIGITVFHYESNLTRFANIAGTAEREENNVMTGNLVKLLYSKRGNYLTQEDWLLIGADFQRERSATPVSGASPGERVRHRTQPRDGEFVQYNYAVFAQAEARPVAPLKVTLGLRYDLFDGEVDFTMAPNAQTPARHL